MQPPPHPPQLSLLTCNGGDRCGEFSVEWRWELPSPLQALISSDMLLCADESCRDALGCVGCDRFWKWVLFSLACTFILATSPWPHGISSAGTVHVLSPVLCPHLYPRDACRQLHVVPRFANVGTAA